MRVSIDLTVVLMPHVRAILSQPNDGSWNGSQVFLYSLNNHDLKQVSHSLGCVEFE